MLAPPIPAKNERGMLITSAHGQEMTKKVSARYTHTSQSEGRPIASVRISGGSSASASAAMHTAGVYTRANLEMKFSDLDLRELAFSTRSRILDTVDSPNSLVVRIFSTPVILMHPLVISCPTSISRGRLSPVNALVFRLEVPSTTTPSMGTFSPGCTTITLPISTSSGSTLSSVPSRSMLA